MSQPIPLSGIKYGKLLIIPSEEHNGLAWSLLPSSLLSSHLSFPPFPSHSFHLVSSPFPSAHISSPPIPSALTPSISSPQKTHQSSHFPCRSNPRSFADEEVYNNYCDVVGDFSNNVMRQQQQEVSTHGRTYSDDEDEGDEGAGTGSVRPQPGPSSRRGVYTKKVGWGEGRTEEGRGVGEGRRGEEGRGKG
jgi:hypothetical protein